ncbi:PHP domain-containing protein [Candidatus Woesearchaeota archaeon]|nr:PHP domain-containing protein [Candidatus Woesearchaeota archaeon]MBT3537738.1 PHP domain-containing protein [Candidatus Woesearchaeota archaeon]MBT4717471.1 PHP domain-containing protein [Candidatus Woesearchaeota archaeon]MBT7105407.1 PHP domain-containing protein [Candidatus Woesearchaeota archaeon]MBT7931597.1 PHP domain-containing protein [Candidatus Woesearchaeota archaeon]
MDLHYHSTYSDGLVGIKDTLRLCKRANIGISVTDHNAVKGSILACKHKDVVAIPAVEVGTIDCKDILFYFYDPKELEQFYDKMIKNSLVNNKYFDLRKTSKSAEEYMDEASNYNCLISLPHPFSMRPKRSYEMFNENKRLFKKLDAIEVINSSQSIGGNRKATEWALKSGKAFTGGSDCHNTNLLGTTVTVAYANNTGEFLDAIKKQKNQVIGGNLKSLQRFDLNWTIVRNNLKKI